MSADLEETKEYLASCNSIGSKVIAGCVGAAASAVFQIPIVGPIVSPFLAHQLEKGGKEIMARYLAPRQHQRVAAAVVLTNAAIDARLARGEKPRSDGFFDDTDERSAADEVTEAALNASLLSHEEKKLPYLAHILAAICFNSLIERPLANLYVDTVRSMSFRGVMLLDIISKHNFPEFSLGSGEFASFTDEESLRAEAFSLVQLGLVYRGEFGRRKEGDRYVGVTDVLSPEGVRMDKMYLTDLGWTLHRLMEVDDALRQSPDYRRALQICSFNVSEASKQRR